MIGEITLTCGGEVADRRSNDFLKSLAKPTGTIYEFKQHLLTELDRLSEEGLIYVPNFNQEKYDERRQEIWKNLKESKKEAAEAEGSKRVRFGDDSGAQQQLHPSLAMRDRSTSYKGLTVRHSAKAEDPQLD